ncbi:LysR family transcriptional regulator [Candidimonas sp. SYP-B2681]|uniref:LysR substrate-binding domain-containing protein n=1 Tax=Candidimonas sp. SYP-B2681 TaxID=2497686 RepID=UPI000F87580C|nr:LysR substrate-binding domain-containing protein [Candidimonas sp. SYP-B2681]RTZ43207.1 LysR family transcriptional regulator [Candidimonas sp. SYP-B2681]
MELRHLRYFVALAERLNFTEAAKQVHVTQPTLSHQIKQLENELGKPLFERSERRLRMTSAGELLLPKALEALGTIDSGIALLKASTTDLTGHIRIATTPTFNITVVPHAVARYIEQHAAIKITVEEFTSEEIAEKIREGALDMAIAYRPKESNGLLFEPLCNEELVLIVRKDHALAGRKRVRMIELHRRDLILPTTRFATRHLLQEAFESAGAQPNVIIESGTIASLLNLVVETGAATILSRYALPLNSEFQMVPIESPRPVRTPGLVWAQHKERLPIEVAFASVLRSVTNSILLEKTKGESPPPTT